MMGDVVRSKPWLGLMGNVSAVMATSAAFGLAMYLGIEFIGINLAAPFLMIGKSCYIALIAPVCSVRRNNCLSKIVTHSRIMYAKSTASLNDSVNSPRLMALL